MFSIRTANRRRSSSTVIQRAPSHIRYPPAVPSSSALVTKTARPLCKTLRFGEGRVLPVDAPLPVRNQDILLRLSVPFFGLSSYLQASPYGFSTPARAA